MTRATGGSFMDWRQLLPVLLMTFLVQAFVPLARVGTTYGAIDAQMSIAEIGIVSGVYALLPVLFTVWVGRINDKGFARYTAMSGGICLCVAVAGLLFGPAFFLSFMIFNAILGMGQTIMMASLQFLTGLSTSRDRQDAALGHYMVVTSAGQIVGPLILSFVAAGPFRLSTGILTASLGGMALITVSAVFLKPPSRRPTNHPPPPETKIVELLRNGPFFWVIIASAVCVTISDLILVYFPLLGTERGIDPQVVGFLLGLRAFVAMFSRLMFAALVRLMGHRAVMLTGMLAAAVGIIALALPIGLLGLAAGMIFAGFGLGIATTAAFAITLQLSPPSAMATAVSLRILANRVGQFLIPLASGLVIGAVGTAGIFMIMAAGLMGSGTTAFWKAASRRAI